MTDYEMDELARHENELAEQEEKIKKEIWEEAQSTLKEIKKAEHMLFDAIVNFEEYLRQKDGFDYHEWSKGLEDLNIKVGEALENITNKIYDADTFVE